MIIQIDPDEYKIYDLARIMLTNSKITYSTGRNKHTIRIIKNKQYSA